MKILTRQLGIFIMVLVCMIMITLLYIAHDVVLGGFLLSAYLKKGKDKSILLCLWVFKTKMGLAFDSSSAWGWKMDGLIDPTSG